MKTTEMRILSKPKLNDAVFILAPSDQYGINKMIVNVLIDHMRAEKFAELYSPHFPDCVIAEETGLCHLPRYDLYKSTIFKPNIVLMTGDIGPSHDDGPAHYEVLNCLFNSAKDWGCRRFLSLGVFVSDKAEDRIYVSATSRSLVSSITGKLGGKPLTMGRIDGLTGMTLGLARLHGFPAICILGMPENNNYPDDLAQEIFHFVLDVLSFKTR